MDIVSQDKENNFHLFVVKKYRKNNSRFFQDAIPLLTYKSMRPVIQ